MSVPCSLCLSPAGYLLQFCQPVPRQWIYPQLIMMFAVFNVIFSMSLSMWYTLQCCRPTCLSVWSQRYAVLAAAARWPCGQMQVQSDSQIAIWRLSINQCLSTRNSSFVHNSHSHLKCHFSNWKLSSANTSNISKSRAYSIYHLANLISVQQLRYLKPTSCRMLRFTASPQITS